MSQTVGGWVFLRSFVVEASMSQNWDETSHSRHQNMARFDFHQPVYFSNGPVGADNDP
jgi:hypothetical protein